MGTSTTGTDYPADAETKFSLRRRSTGVTGGQQAIDYKFFELRGVIHGTGKAGTKL